MRTEIGLKHRLRRNAEEILTNLRRSSSKELAQDGLDLVEKLRRIRDFPAMERLAESVSRHDPGNAKLRRLYAQSLIETGHATAAIDVLSALSRRLRRGDHEWAEARGLIGRAYKQIFADETDPTNQAAQKALKRSIAAYREPFEIDPRANTWHGVNLLALLHRSEQLGLSSGIDLDAAEVARSVIRVLAEKETKDRDHWHHATLAEAHLALGDWSMAEEHLHGYVTDPAISAFDLSSTLRQFSEIWAIDHESRRGQGLIAILQAHLMKMPGGELDLSKSALQRLGAQPDPEAGQLEAILGTEGPVTWHWWQTGLERAKGVCAIRQRLGQRIGTGFLVRAGSFGLEPPEALLVLTNFHVVNSEGANPGLAPSEVEVEFEVGRPSEKFKVDSVIWQSPVHLCDASFLKLENVPDGIEPQPIASSIAQLASDSSVTSRPRVYVIGHPGGRDLAFSFQDNELIDHEAPRHGTPPNPAVCRVHYLAPTEAGSSGSPVFNSGMWQVVALHHMGGRILSRLNGKSGTYPANQGIWIQSVRQAIASG